MDLAIIGGGPAGTSAALEALKRGLSVSIWERDTFPRDKVCGEFLSSEAIPLLEQEIPAVLARGAIIRHAEFVSRGARTYAFPLPSPARGLSRLVMDRALWQAVDAKGGQTYQGTVVRRIRRLGPKQNRGANWELECGDDVSEKARSILVGCGRWWALKGFPSPAREGSAGGGPWLGVKAHFSGVASRDAVEMYFFPGGYCGLAPIEDGLYNTCCLVHLSLIRESGSGGATNFAAWLRSLVRHPMLEVRLRAATQVSATVATAPVRPARRCADHEGVLLAGDAAGFLDPFTGDGISQALHSGRLAAQALAIACQNGDGPGAGAAMARAYRQRLSSAVGRSYRVASLVRALVRAPAPVQEVAAAALPWLGPRLLAATRWRAKGSDE